MCCFNLESSNKIKFNSGGWNRFDFRALFANYNCLNFDVFQDEDVNQLIGKLENELKSIKDFETKESFQSSILKFYTNVHKISCFKKRKVRSVRN